ncbi:MAG TPA: cation:proton antiporter [Nocardioidaceae bacterium]|nr:cation:proton antiporter [Nocardioidaceae bacterium]
MDATAILIATAALFAWGLVSRRLERADLSAPIVFTFVGALLAPLGAVEVDAAPETLKPLVEVTLVWVLFSDAARVRVQDLRQDLATYVRLLGIGLPLSVLAGWGLAIVLFPGFDLWLALLVGAALAPTDAALGVPVVTNKVVPSRVRRLITVESGLNDGIATPVVMVAIAGVASAEGVADAPGVAEAVIELVLGVGVGSAVGLGGGWLLRRARDRGWAEDSFAGAAVLALALTAYTAALVLDGNGFVAAFCGGVAFGAAAGRRGPAELRFLEQTSGLVSLLIWLGFGAVAVSVMIELMAATTLLYAVLSLTVVRMAPVALALIGAGYDRRTVAFVGWFGPRGLASLVFALLALDELGPRADEAVAVIGATVLLSVLAHGATADPLAHRYGEAVAGAPEPGGPLPDMPVRGLPRRSVNHGDQEPDSTVRRDE